MNRDMRIAKPSTTKSSLSVSSSRDGDKSLRDIAKHVNNTPKRSDSVWTVDYAVLKLQQHPKQEQAAVVIDSLLRLQSTYRQVFDVHLLPDSRTEGLRCAATIKDTGNQSGKDQFVILYGLPSDCVAMKKAYDDAVALGLGSLTQHQRFNAQFPAVVFRNYMTPLNKVGTLPRQQPRVATAFQIWIKRVITQLLDKKTIYKELCVDHVLYSYAEDLFYLRSPRQFQSIKTPLQHIDSSNQLIHRDLTDPFTNCLIYLMGSVARNSHLYISTEGLVTSVLRERALQVQRVYNSTCSAEQILTLFKALVYFPYRSALPIPSAGDIPVDPVKPLSTEEQMKLDYEVSQITQLAEVLSHQIQKLTGGSIAQTEAYESLQLLAKRINQHKLLTPNLFCASSTQYQGLDYAKSLLTLHAAKLSLKDKGYVNWQTLLQRIELITGKEQPSNVVGKGAVADNHNKVAYIIPSEPPTSLCAMIVYAAGIAVLCFIAYCAMQNQQKEACLSRSPDVVVVIAQPLPKQEEAIAV